MPARIPPADVRNLQQIEAVVAGPDGANRIFMVTGQFEVVLSANSSQQDETFTLLVGPVFTRQQFLRAICTASLAKTSLRVQRPPFDFSWEVTATDADQDDESGQVELRIDVSVLLSGVNNQATITGIAFHVTILAAMPE